MEEEQQINRNKREVFEWLGEQIVARSANPKELYEWLCEQHATRNSKELSGWLAEQYITRNPKELFAWIVSMNEADSMFYPLVEDQETVKEVRVLCLLFARSKISLHDFLWHVSNLDLFEHRRLGPTLANLTIAPHDGSVMVPFPKDAFEEVISQPGWTSVFK